VSFESNERKNDSVYSTRVKAGKRRTYFFDVRTTRANDFYLTITESRKRAHDDGYDRHKIFLYKEDFNKFVKGLGDAVDFVKTDLMPDFNFDAFNHDFHEGEGDFQPVAALEMNSKGEQPSAAAPIAPLQAALPPRSAPKAVDSFVDALHDSVDKW
jgi:hypothetical protein